MGPSIPHSIKIKVIEEWIQGISRDKIAQNNGIGNGTVTSIIEQSKTNIADIDLMRVFALKMKKENIDLNYFASAFRLKKVLDRLDLPEGKIEALIEEMNIHCFKQKVGLKEFFFKIDEVSNFANKLHVPIYDILFQINQKTKQLSELDKAVEIKQRQIKQKIEEYNITTKDLEQYRSNKPLIDKIYKLEFALSNKEKEKSLIMEDLIGIDNENIVLRSKKNVPESEFIEANKKLPINNPLRINELQEITDKIYSNPSSNVDIIKIMRERYLRKPTGKSN